MNDDHDCRFREHSVILNRVSWEIHDAMGLIPEGATEWHGDILADLPEICRLIRLGLASDKEFLP